MRDCANCFHRKPVLKEDGTWTADCEKWDCEFLSRENMIEKTEAKGGDLISREALKKKFDDYIKANPNISGVFELGKVIIDNAPSVEPYISPAVLKQFAKYVAEHERPQGTCKTCRCRDPEDKKCDCGALERQGCPFPVSDGYYCKYYEEGGAV